MRWTDRFHQSITTHTHTLTPQQHQAEENRRKKEEAERAKAKGLDPSTAGHVIKFRVERRVSSDDLMLTDVSFCVGAVGVDCWLPRCV